MVIRVAGAPGGLCADFRPTNCAGSLELSGVACGWHPCGRHLGPVRVT